MSILDIDHVMLDIGKERALTWFASAGFTVRPLRHHAIMGGGVAGGRGGSAVVTFSASKGTVANYLELSFADKSTSAPKMLDLLSNGPGIASLVHATTDFAGDVCDWKDLFEFGLEFKLPMEARTSIRAQTIEAALMTDPRVPVRFGICAYEHVDEYSLPNLIEHPNGALGWSKIQITLNEDAFESQCRSVEKLYKRSPNFKETGSVRWDHTHTSIALRAGAPRVELFIDVENLDQTAEFLSQCRLDMAHRSNSVVIDAEIACGMNLVFRQKSSLHR